jgi:hypothetical protein
VPSESNSSRTSDAACPPSLPWTPGLVQEMRRTKLGLLLAASLLALNFLLATGLIGSGGECYSGATLAYRRQTDAFLRGSIALDADPRGLSWDLVWANGVQQPWGMGVPAWRLPFEMLAKVLGFAAFPDRVALGIAFALVTYVLMRVFWTPRGTVVRFSDLQENPGALLAPLLLVLFPPFLTLCRAPFMVYGEAQAYSYLVGLLVISGLILFVRSASIRSYLCLSFFSGAIAFVRPTLVFCGAAALIVAFFHTRHQKWQLRSSFAGIGLFCLALGCLYLSNRQRFGSGWEFGHSLNLNDVDTMRFASRFDHPFRTEPLWPASRELLSTLFLLGDTFNTLNRHRPGMFCGQSPTFRWREFYFETYDLTYFALAATAWIWLAWGIWRRRRLSFDAAKADELTALSAWSLLSAVALFGFYLRWPFTSSRYMIDFAPAIAAAIWVTLSLISNSIPRRKLVARGFIAVVTLWWGVQVVGAKTDLEARYPQPIAYADLMSVMREPQTPTPPLPNGYKLGMDIHRYGLFLNGAGWNMTSGETMMSVTLFVDDAKFLAIDVAPVGDDPYEGEAYDCIQAKVGLETLELKTSQDTPEGRRLVFRGPQTESYQSGVQVAFLGMTAPQDISDGRSRFRLLNVRWRDE